MPVPERPTSRGRGGVAALAWTVAGRRHLASLARALAAALTFLTRVPLPGPVRHRDGDIARGAFAFPLVGAVLGGLVGGVAALLAPVVTPIMAGALAVGVELAATGALHLDGLADSADGLAGRDPEGRLAIMRDHALGVYGASVLVLDLLVKVAALGTLSAGGAAVVIPVTVAVFAVSRAAPLPLAAVLPYARSGGGTGLVLSGQLGFRRAVAGIVVAAAVGGAVVAMTGVVGVVAVAPACIAVVTVVGLASARRLGGVTGDVMGAAVELTATLGLVAAIGVRA